MSVILLVGKDGSFVSSEEQAFNRSDLSLKVPHDTEEAISELLSARCDLAFLDWDVLAPRGEEVLRSVRRMGGVTPIVVLARGASVTDIVCAMKNGADDFIEKPIDTSKLIAVASEFLTSQSRTPHYLARKLDRYIRENCSSRLTRSAICREFRISASYLSQLFKRHVGVSYRHRVTYYRVQKAKLLLKSTRLAIYQVADECGFLDYRRLDEAFRKIEKCTPSMFRRATGEAECGND